jgi:hypothetical protein
VRSESNRKSEILLKATDKKVRCSEQRSNLARVDNISEGAHCLSSNGHGECYLDVNPDSVGIPATAVVMLDRATNLAGERRVPLEVVLGCLIAHELGHVLLRSPRHSPFGLMRNPWNPDDMHKARAGHLGFTDDQANSIRDAVRQLTDRSRGRRDEGQKPVLKSKRKAPRR